MKLKDVQLKDILVSKDGYFFQVYQLPTNGVVYKTGFWYKSLDILLENMSINYWMEDITEMVLEDCVAQVIPFASL